MSVRSLLGSTLLGILTFAFGICELPAAEKWTRCKHNPKYKAKQIGATVIIVAFGAHPTSGYKTQLRQLPIEPFPPQFELVEQKPTGIVLQVITPFAEIATFQSPKPIRSVVVHDGNGKHTVKVLHKANAVSKNERTSEEQDSFLTKDGKLRKRIIYKVSQGGFAGFTGFIWTVETDGSWNRRSFINLNIREIDQKGKLSSKQLKMLAGVLSKNKAGGLSGRFGGKPMVNPRIISLTIGKRESQYYLRGGTDLPKPRPKGNTMDDRFLRVVSVIRTLLKTAPKG